MKLFNEKVRLDYERHELWICADSRLERESRAFSCAKEPDTVEWIESCFRPGDTALDIGANIGAYSLIMAKMAGDGGMIYAFEPGWPNFHQLNKNIILNRLEKSITAINMAVSSAPGIADFNYRDLEFGSSLHTFGKAVDFVGNEFTPDTVQRVLSISVDEFVSGYKIKPVNHVKVDVDGIEAEIIKGAAETLKDPQCRSLMVELNEAFESDIKCIERLCSAGFKVISKTANPSQFYSSDTVYNYIFKKG